MIEFEPLPPRRPYETVVPLINVVFLLLIFFLLAGTLGSTDAVDVSLPQGRMDDKSPGEVVTLLVEADGFVWLGDSVMAPNLAAYSMKDFFEKSGTNSVAIKADARAQASDLLVLMEGLRKVGIEEVTLVTERDQ